ncbi:MAG: hypothetical protein ABGX80_06225 [Cobetia sp.]|uniref:hypothetical protein n=1 Tax=Cobetia sp. TaxID=1873876 RepID=UPI0032421D90|tara:strand:+ start:848 stop:1747 length:900 start_codon:yes stop_codon:yes gene_type:complete
MLIKDFAKSPYKIRIYLLGISGVLILLIALNYYVLPLIHDYFGFSYSSTVSSFFNNIIALVGSSLFASGFYLLLTPSGLSENDINLIYSHDIKGLLKNMVNETERFSYLGHTARWNRSFSLPKLREISNDKKSTRHVDLVIIDPNCEASCLYYSQFGHANRDKGGEVKSIHDVRVELITTYLCCVKENMSPFMEVNLHFTKNISLFRYDISDNGILLSKPYKGDPALYFPKGTFFYDSYKQEFNIAKDQSDRVYLERIEVLDYESVKQLLLAADIFDDYMNEDFVDAVWCSYQEMTSPY